MRQETGQHLLDIIEAAEQLGTTPAALRKRIERGRLRGRKIRGRWFVELSSLQDVPTPKVDSGQGVSPQPGQQSDTVA